MHFRFLGSENNSSFLEQKIDLKDALAKISLKTLFNLSGFLVILISIMEDFFNECFEKWLNEGDPLAFWRTMVSPESLKLFQSKYQPELIWLYLGDKPDEAMCILDKMKERVLYESQTKQIESIRFISASNTKLSLKDDWLLCKNHSMVYGSIQTLVTIEFTSMGLNGVLSLPIKVKSSWFLNDLHAECLKSSSYNHDYDIVDFSNYQDSLGISDKLSNFNHHVRSMDGWILIRGTAYHQSLLEPLM
jgi:hypothetical protein